MADRTAARMGGPEVEENLDRLNDLLEQVEAMEGPSGEVARGAISALAAIYGEALARSLDAAGARDAARQLADDPLVGHLMALHGFHPDPPERRIADALAEAQHVGAAGAAQAVHLIGIDDGVAQVTVAGGYGAGEIVASVPDVVLGAAPELRAVEAGPPPTPPTFIPLESLHRRVRT